MENYHGYIWLASYSKFGNAWVHLFLHALKNEGDLIDSLDSIRRSNEIISGRYCGILKNKSYIIQFLKQGKVRGWRNN